MVGMTLPSLLLTAPEVPAHLQLLTDVPLDVILTGSWMVQAKDIQQVLLQACVG